MGNNDWQALQAARAFAAQQLQIAFPHLIPGDSLATAAKNIRIELKRAFPSVKFSVRSKSYSMGNNINIDWTDGPTTKQVEEIANQYDAGSFDGMTDSYNYRKDRAFIDAFGSAKYIFCNRHHSDKAVAAAIRTVCNRYPGNASECASIPTVEDYNMGRTHSMQFPHLGEWSRLINIELSKRTYCLTAKQSA